MKLLDALHDAGCISTTNHRMLLNYAAKWQLRGYDAIIQTHIMAEHSLADAIAEIFKLDRLYNFDSADVDSESLLMLSWDEAQKFSCFVPFRDDDGTFQVCLLDPLDENVSHFLGKRLPRYRPLIMDRRLIFRSIEDAYPLEHQIPSLIQLV